MKMRRNKMRSYLHFVWATKKRHPLITEEIERDVYRYICQVCLDDDCEVLAIGGLSDHVHLLVSFTNTLSYADFMKHIKGGSSRFITQRLKPDAWFQWQENYAVYAVSPRDKKMVTAYILNQKDRHARGDLWPEAEETYEEFDTDNPHPSE